MSIKFKYEVGQHVYWNDKLCQILSRSYMETSKNNIIKYNLRCHADSVEIDVQNACCNTFKCE